MVCRGLTLTVSPYKLACHGIAGLLIQGKQHPRSQLRMLMAKHLQQVMLSLEQYCGPDSHADGSHADRVNLCLHATQPG